MESYRDIGPVDFDPFAPDPAASPDAAAGAPPAPAETPAPPPEQAPPETKPDYVIPKAPEIPVVKFAGEEKPAEPAPAKLTYKDIGPVDFDPFEQGSMPVEAGKAVAAGATETTAGMIKGLGGQRVQAMTDERARQARQKWLQDNGYGDRIVEIATLPVEQQQQLRQAMGAANAEALKEMKLEDDYFYKMGVNLDEWSADKFKAAHDYEDSWTRKLGEGFGSIAPFIAVNFVPGLGQAASLEAGYASAVGSQIDDAIKAGASKEQLLAAMRYGGVGGLTEQIPMEVLFERIPLPAMGKVMGAIVKIAGTAFAEGSQEAAQTAIQNIVANYNYDPKRDITEGVAEAALIGAIVGGTVAAPGAGRNHDKEDQTKVDEPDVAAPAQEPGTPAAADPNAGESGPGTGTGATPKPPADVPKPAGPATKPGEVFTPAGRPAGPATQPGEVFTPTKPLPSSPVEVTRPGQTSAEIAAALGGAEPAAAQTEDQGDEFSVASEVSTEGVTKEDLDAGLLAHTERLRQAVKGRTPDISQAKNADRTVAADPNADLAAALANRSATVDNPLNDPFKRTDDNASPAVATPAAAAATPAANVTPENLGTGQALKPAVAPTPAAAEPALVETPAAAAEPVVEAKKKRNYKRPLQVTEAAAEPALVETPATQDQNLAAFTPAPAVAADATKLAETPVVTAQTPTPAAAAPTVGAAKAVEPAPKPGAKGDAIKAKAKVKMALPAPEAKPAPKPQGAVRPIEGPTTVIKREDIAAKPEAKPAPAPAPAAGEGPAKAPPTQLSRDAAEHARGHPDLQQPALTALPQFRDTVHEVAAKVVAAWRKSNPKAPLNQIIRAAQNDIVAGVKKRLEPVVAAEREEHQRKEEAKPALKEERKAQAEAKAKSMAEAKKGQQRERAPRTPGATKSGTGIRVEKEKATKSAIEKNKAEVAAGTAKVDKLLKDWEYVHSLQTALPKNPKKENKAKVEAKRAKYMERKAQIQELRAQQSEAGLEAREGFSERAVQMRDAVKEVLAAHPLPKADRRGDYSPGVLLDHLKKFKAAMKLAVAKVRSAQKEAAKAAGKVLKEDDRFRLAKTVDRTHNSMEENLAIFANKVLEREPRLSDVMSEPGQKQMAALTRAFPSDFASAQLFMEKGADGDFYTTVTSEVHEGSHYEESMGEDVAGTEAARVREDTDVKTSRVHRTGEDTGAVSAEDTLLSEDGDADALMRSGRAETQERDASRKEREEAGYKDFRHFEVTRPDGKKVTVRGETRKGASVLREINRLLLSNNPHGFISVIQNALVKHLNQLVGDIDVHFVSGADMMQLHDKPGQAAGLYYNYSPEQRAKGQKPQVFLNEELLLDSDAYAHTGLHELVHAATSLALRLDVRGTQKIVTNMAAALRQQMTPAQLQEFRYAFTNPAEFIAEAMSNPRFQELLGSLNMPEHVRQQVSGLAADRKPTWWDGVVGMISNAIGMVWGQRGHSYMDQIAKLYPDIALSAQGQLRLSKEEVAAGRPKFQPTSPKQPAAGDIAALQMDFNQIVGAIKSRASNAFTPKQRRVRDMLNTTLGIIRDSEKKFGGINNTLEKLGLVLLSKDEIRKELREIPAAGANSKELEHAQLVLRSQDRGQYNELSYLLHEGVRFGVDPSASLTDPSNSHVNRTGVRHYHKRRMHAQLEAAWNAMSPEAQAVGQATINHFRKTSAFETDMLIKTAVQSALDKFGHAFPAGKTMDDAVAWVRSNPNKRFLNNTQTQEDIDWRAAIGNTAETVARLPMLREIHGMYVPFSRRGAHYIKIIERPFGTMANQRNVPTGGILDAITPAEHNAPNRILFPNQADYENFADNYDGHIAQSAIWVDQNGNKTVDPTTGRMTSQPYVDPATNQLVTPVKVLIATVQNKRVQMSDNHSYLVQLGKDMQAQGHDVGSVGISAQTLRQTLKTIATPDINALAANVMQTQAGGQTISQEAIVNAIYDAYTRTITTPSHAHRGLKRDAVLGNDMDLLLNTRDHNSAFAHHVANLIVSPQLNEASRNVNKYIRDQRDIEGPGSRLTIERQALLDEINRRIIHNSGDPGGGLVSDAVNNVMQTSMLKHLFSPHYSIMNSMQPYMTTLPVLGADHGTVQTLKEMGKAYAVGGAGGFGGGLKESGKAVRNLARRIPTEAKDNDQWWSDQVANEADGGRLQELFKLIKRLGFGASSSIEAPGIAEMDRTFLGKVLGRVVDISKALPEAIEGVNRYTTAIAAYRMAYRGTRNNDGSWRFAPMSHEDAMRYAVHKVEQTQGGYGNANNPSFINPKLHPLMKLPLQFRRYSVMYANLFYRNLAHIVGGSREERIRAAKTVAGLAFTTVTLAGMYGLPLVEPLRFFVNVFAAFGVLDDDWSDDEVAMQKWMAGMIKWASGSQSLGDTLAEANMRGWTRLINIDTSNSFGADSMFMFGEPKTMDEKGTVDWVFKAILGAGGGMVWDSGKALLNGDIAGAIPYPKVADNFWKAYKLSTEGTVSKRTGEQYAKPIGAVEAAGQILGFKPASSSRQWEGGGGSKAVKRREESGARHDLMGQWRSKTGAEKSRFYRVDIAEWNKNHRNPADKIQMSDLVRSVRSKKAQERRDKRAEAYED